MASEDEVREARNEDMADGEGRSQQRVSCDALGPFPILTILVLSSLHNHHSSVSTIPAADLCLPYSSPNPSNVNTPTISS